jgi:hypothetical protein
MDSRVETECPAKVRRHTVRIGAFGKKTELRNVGATSESGAQALRGVLLHADVVRLKGAEGVLETLRIVPLKRQAGLVLFGLMVGNPR